jgi:DNA-binding GntR family transcriptional regulator
MSITPDGPVLELTPSGVQRSGSLQDKAYAIIRRAIMQGDLEPNAQLSEPSLADQLGMSRTPIREALKRLEEAGLVRIVPRHGAIVTDISAEDIVQIYQLREALECYAIQFASEYGNTPELEDLISAIEQSAQWIQDGEIEKINEADVRLHQYIAQLSRNQMLIRLVDQLLDQIIRLRLMTPKVEGRLPDQAEEHLCIVRALQEGKTEEAQAALQFHLRNVRDTFLQLRLRLGRTSSSTFGSNEIG